MIFKDFIFTVMFMHHNVEGKIKQTWPHSNDQGRLLQLSARIVPEDSKTLET